MKFAIFSVFWLILWSSTTVAIHSKSTDFVVSSNYDFSPNKVQFSSNSRGKTIENTFRVPESFNLQLVKQDQTKIGELNTYQLFLNDVIVLDAKLKMLYNQKGEVVQIHNALPDFNQFQIQEDQPNKEKGVLAIHQLAQQHDLPSADFKTDAVYIINNTNNKIELVERVNFKDRNAVNRRVLIHPNHDKPIDYSNIKYALPDTILSGMVFNPDPLTTSKTVYGEQFLDFFDKDTLGINDERQFVSVLGTFEDDQFKLKNKYVEIVDNVNPFNLDAQPLDGVYDYTRNQSTFEDFNTFYHITKMGEYLDDLGFESVTDVVVKADAKAGQDDVSFFSGDGVSDQNLNFGIGGVDDGEDAMVIIHEYMHATSANAEPSNFANSERRALDEGLADYYAISYSYKIDTFNHKSVFKWDGHNEFWNGRTIEHELNYKTSVNDERIGIHTLGTIWAAALVDLWPIIGIEKTDVTMTQTLFMLSGGVSFPQAAELFLESFELLYPNDFVLCDMHNVFVKYGIQDEDLSYCLRNEIEAYELNLSVTDTVFCQGGELSVNFSSNFEGVQLIIDPEEILLSKSASNFVVDIPDSSIFVKVFLTDTNLDYASATINVSSLDCRFQKMHISNSTAFAENSGLLRVDLANPEEVNRLVMINSVGAIIYENTNPGATVFIDGTNLQSGSYHVMSERFVRDTESQQVVKFR